MCDAGSGHERRVVKDSKTFDYFFVEHNRKPFYPVCHNKA